MTDTGRSSSFPVSAQVIGVLTGGRSRERERSLQTGRDVAEALSMLGHRVEVIDTAGSTFTDEVRTIDTAFLALAGRYAEDGSLQGFLETCGIPYTGSGVLASALAMCKPTAKAVARAAGVPVLPHVPARSDRDPTLEAKEILDRFNGPVIVKPQDEGSSLGMAVARNCEELAEVLAMLRKEGYRLFIEPFIVGRTVTVGILEENGQPVALPIAEVRTDREFYDHAAKIDPSLYQRDCPADLPSETTELVADAACRAHRALGCSGYSRSDFVITSDGRPFWLEVNTLPALRRTAALPRMAAAIGMPYEELVVRILGLAIDPRIR